MVYSGATMVRGGGRRQVRIGNHSPTSAAIGLHSRPGFGVMVINNPHAIMVHTNNANENMQPLPRGQCVKHSSIVQM